MLQFEALLRCFTINSLLLTIFEDKKQNFKQMSQKLTFYAPNVTLDHFQSKIS